MRRDGFSLVELVVVIAIMGTLLAMAGLAFRNYSQKAGVEGEVKQMYSDLADARSQALYRKGSRYVSIAGTRFSVYTSSSPICGTLPASGLQAQKTLKYSINTSSADNLCFDQRGVANLTSTSAAIPESPRFAICIQQANPGTVDSVVLTATGIVMGKVSPGGTCSSANITVQ